MITLFILIVVFVIILGFIKGLSEQHGENLRKHTEEMKLKFAQIQAMREKMRLENTFNEEWLAIRTQVLKRDG